MKKVKKVDKNGKIIEKVCVEALGKIFSKNKFIEIIKEMGFKYIVLGKRRTRFYVYKKLPKVLNFSDYLRDGAISFLMSDLSVFGLGSLEKNIIYRI